MNKSKLMMVAMLLLLGTVSMVSPQSQEVRFPDQDPEELSKTLPASYYLGGLSIKHHCFFTFEEAYEEGEPRDGMEGHIVSRSSEKNDLQADLEHLRRFVPHLTYEITGGSPRIVHIIDTRLLSREGYGVERVLKNLDFEGTVNDLVTTISKQETSVSLETYFFIGAVEFPDRTTKVRVKGEGLKVREALTNFVPLEGRQGRFIWIARTKLAKAAKTYIYYPYQPEK